MPRWFEALAVLLSMGSIGGLLGGRSANGKSIPQKLASIVPIACRPRCGFNNRRCFDKI
jgi:hypothetical protein